MKQEFIKSFDGTQIATYTWDNVTSPIGVVMIAHGICEHAQRYAPLAEYLNSRGYIAFADDHRAHGNTDPNSIGHHDGDVFGDTVKDLVFFNEMLCEKYKLPVFIIGHSYGSFLTQALILEDVDLTGVCLLGTSKMPLVACIFAQLALLLPKLIAPKARPRMMTEGFDYLSYRRFKPKVRKSCWVTSIEENQLAFNADPFCGKLITINVAYYFMKGLVKSAIYPDKLHPNLPIATFCGSEDVVGSYGKGVDKLHRFYNKNGVYHVERHTYDGARHDLIYDYCSAQVMADIADFLDKARTNAFDK